MCSSTPPNSRPVQIRPGSARESREPRGRTEPTRASTETARPEDKSGESEGPLAAATGAERGERRAAAEKRARVRVGGGVKELGRTKDEGGEGRDRESERSCNGKEGDEEERRGANNLRVLHIFATSTPPPPTPTRKRTGGQHTHKKKKKPKKIEKPKISSSVFPSPVRLSLSLYLSLLFSIFLSLRLSF